VVGDALVGLCVGVPVVGEAVGCAEVGDAVVGDAVVGVAVAGESVVGEAVAGVPVAGDSVIGDPVSAQHAHNLFLLLTTRVQSGLLDAASGTLHLPLTGEVPLYNLMFGEDEEDLHPFQVSFTGACAVPRSYKGDRCMRKQRQLLEFVCKVFARITTGQKHCADPFLGFDH
jgi:hypothetical protein